MNSSLFSLFKEKIYFMNTIILIVVWSQCAYSFYFTEFYMKYVPVSNIYYLALIMGSSDFISSFIFNILKRYLSSKQMVIVLSGGLAAFSFVFSLTLFINGNEENLSIGLEIFYTAMIFGMRFFSAITFMTAYYCNNEYFPTLLKGAIFAITNIAARLASVMSPLVAEWMSNPSITVSVCALIASLATFKLNKEEISSQ